MDGNISNCTGYNVFGCLAMSNIQTCCKASCPPTSITFGMRTELRNIIYYLEVNTETECQFVEAFDWDVYESCGFMFWYSRGSVNKGTVDVQPMQ